VKLRQIVEQYFKKIKKQMFQGILLQIIAKYHSMKKWLMIKSYNYRSNFFVDNLYTQCK